MNLLKLNLLVASVSALLCLLLLVWNESSLSCGTTTLRLLETMFAIVAWWAIKEQAKISWKNE